MLPEQFGRYEIKNELGHGGMAVVYLAHDPRFKRNVALKVMNRALQDQEKFRGRFEREARTVASLEHPAIVPVYDYGEDNEQLYLVMRYMSGGSLSDKIIQRPLTIAEIVPIFNRIGSALDHAHHEGVIHRDLKPGNILFDQYNNAFLSDFGIVKLTQEAVDLTGSGVIGTPAYMSPEQIHGESNLDGRSDIYTLGIILFECLTGRKPYRADTPVKQMMAHVLNPIPRILDENPNLPPACEMVIQKALSKERADRYSSAQEMTEALTITLSGLQKPPLVLAPDEDATATAASLKVEPPKPPVPLPPRQDDFIVSPPSAKEDATHVGAAALSFQKPTAVDIQPGTPAAQPLPPVKKKRPWLWLIILFVFIVTIAGLVIAYPSLSGQQQTFEIPPPPTNEAPVSTGEAVVDVAPEVLEPTATEPELATAVVPESTPIVSKIEIGQSALGQPIEAVKFGDGELAVLLVGGLHAGFSPGGVLLAEEMIAYFNEQPDNVPPNVSLFIIPNLNPDSAPAPGQLAGRLNGNGVDLNRNWDCRWTADPPWGGEPQPGLGGSQPFSEPEVQALVDFIEQEQMKSVIFWQARASLGLSSPGACADDSEVSRPLALRYGNAADYPVADFEDVTDTIVFGDVTNWLDAQGIPAISVLLPNYLESDFGHNLTAVLAVLEKTATDETQN